MPRSRPRATSLREDDRALAGAVGLVLMLAATLTAYSHAVYTKLPVYGEEAEHAWDNLVGEAFLTLARDITESGEARGPRTAVVPMPPEPKSISIPLLGDQTPLPPSGSVRFTPACAKVTATHVADGATTITDLAARTTGCVKFEAQPIYSAPFAYVLENGGVIRVQGDDAVVLSGPPIGFEATTPSEYRISLGLMSLRGTSLSASNDGTDVRVDVIPGAYTAEVEQQPNAASLTWTLETAYPEAWKTWFEQRLSQAGFVAARTTALPGQSSADYTVACDPVDCSAPAGTGNVVVRIEGPLTSAKDLKLSISYGFADIGMR